MTQNSLLIKSFLNAFDHLGVPHPEVADEHPQEPKIMMKWKTELDAQDLVKAIEQAFPIVNHNFNKNLNGFEIDRVILNEGTVLIVFEIE